MYRGRSNLGVSGDASQYPPCFHSGSRTSHCDGVFRSRDRLLQVLHSDDAVVKSICGRRNGSWTRRSGADGSFGRRILVRRLECSGAVRGRVLNFLQAVVYARAGAAIRSVFAGFACRLPSVPAHPSARSLLRQLQGSLGVFPTPRVICNSTSITRSTQKRAPHVEENMNSSISVRCRRTALCYLLFIVQ